MDSIIIYAPAPRSQRFKLFIPYVMKSEREWLKAQNSAFYHPTQKLWRIVNTSENKKLIVQAIESLKLSS